MLHAAMAATAGPHVRSRVGTPRDVTSATAESRHHHCASVSALTRGAHDGGEDRPPLGAILIGERVGLTRHPVGREHLVAEVAQAGAATAIGGSDRAAGGAGGRGTRLVGAHGSSEVSVEVRRRRRAGARCTSRQGRVRATTPSPVPAGVADPVEVAHISPAFRRRPDWATTARLLHANRDDDRDEIQDEAAGPAPARVAASLCHARRLLEWRREGRFADVGR